MLRRGPGAFCCLPPLPLRWRETCAPQPRLGRFQHAETRSPCTNKVLRPPPVFSFNCLSLKQNSRGAEKHRCAARRNRSKHVNGISTNGCESPIRVQPQQTANSSCVGSRPRADIEFLRQIQRAGGQKQLQNTLMMSRKLPRSIVFSAFFFPRRIAITLASWSLSMSA